MKTETLSKTTRINYTLVALVLISALPAILSGIYFLFLPWGGYSGGRNPTYGITILFDRHTWEELHRLTGIAMTIIAAVHAVIHWKWFLGLFKRIGNRLARRGLSPLNSKARPNVIINSIIAVSFVLTAASGLYFFFAGEHTSQTFIFDPTTWDLIHTWAGIVMTSAALFHFGIHWLWVTKVTSKLAGIKPARATSCTTAQSVPTSQQG